MTCLILSTDPLMWAFEVVSGGSFSQLHLSTAATKLKPSLKKKKGGNLV